MSGMKNSDAQQQKEDDMSSVGSADTDIVGKTIEDESMTTSESRLRRLNEIDPPTQQDLLVAPEKEKKPDFSPQVTVEDNNN
jgi:hypothetical protein